MPNAVRLAPLLVVALSCSREDSSDQPRNEASATVGPEVAARASEVPPRLDFSSGVSVIFEDSKGRTWFGTQQEGVSVFDGRSFTYYTTRDGLSANQIRSIQEDRAGTIWFGTGQGITSFDGEAFVVHTGPNRASPPPMAAGGSPEEEDIWFLGDSGMHAGEHDGQGVYRLVRGVPEYLPFPLPMGADFESPHLVTSIAKGRGGRVWFGTYPRVFGYDGRAFTVIDEKTPGLESAPEPLHVRSVFEDSKGNLWIGNNGLGVLVHDGESISNISAQHGVSLGEDGAPGSLGRVFAIAEDVAGNIWFGTSESGAWRFDGASLTHFTLEDGLTSSAVWTIYRDRKDALWFGMGDGSVCRYDGRAFEVVYRGR